VAEVKARGATVIMLVTEDDLSADITRLADHLLCVPWPGHALLGPVVEAVPLQLLAYYVALARGCDVDKPRNLAKTVTVE
jgi:glutamine---fructose-6-phosphate transaminase (isomerizing)